MIRPTAPTTGYVLLHASIGLERCAGLGGLRETLVAAGWTAQLSTDRLEAWAPARTRTPIVQIHRRHLLIGRWRRREAALSAIVGRSRSARAIADGAVEGGWGDYLLAWDDDAGRLAVLRSPAGALDALWWRRGPLTIVSHEAPDILDPWLPPAAAIDWEALGDIAAALDLFGDRLPLHGVGTVAPGELLIVGDAVERHPVWTPARFCSGPWDDHPDSLTRVVDETVAALVEPHAVIMGELSGGLDSAIVAAGLRSARPDAALSFVNYYDGQAEGDERVYARAAAAGLGIGLTEIEKPVAGVTTEMLTDLPQGVRPALHGLDLFYDADMAGRCVGAGATALLTGQGGDAVFSQAADPYMVVDLRRRLGWPGLCRRLGPIARWTHHSAWTLARLALLDAGPARPERRHPWASDLGGLPPAKAAQVRRLINAQLFWGDCRRARAVELLHPLLSQPVMEHCLRIPVDILTRGPRDRGLARLAFAGRLPDSIVQRRSKGDLSRFYCRVVRESAPELRAWLAEGRLAAAGVIDPADLVAGLADERLIRDPASNRFLILAVLESWARRWEARLAARPRLQPTFEPGQDPRVHVP